MTAFWTLESLISLYQLPSSSLTFTYKNSQRVTLSETTIAKSQVVRCLLQQRIIYETINTDF